MMEIHYQALRASRYWLISEMTLMQFTELVWNNLNADNKVSLFVRYIDIETGKYESRIVNKNK